MMKSRATLLMTKAGALEGNPAAASIGVRHPASLLSRPQSPIPHKSPSTRKARPSVMAKSRTTLMTKEGALESAQDVQVCVPGEYPFLRRFRLRRLTAFLWLQGCSTTFYAMLKQTNVYFCVDYLARLVCQGLWTEALDYLVPRFLQAVPKGQSMEASLLLKFLSQHRSFQLEVVRKQIHVDMRPVWAKAAEIVRDLANRTPEFRNRRLLPAGPMGQQNVLPIGFGFAPFRRRWHVRKHKPQSSDIAKFYLDKRRSSLQLSSSNNNNQKLSHAEYVAKAVDWLQRIMNESLEVLIRPLELNQGCALQSSVRKGTPVTGNVITPECSSVPLTIDEAAHVAPVCHAMFVDWINSAENSAISSMTKTGGAAISQTMLGIMACPAKVSEVISAGNDGTGREVCYTESARQGSYPRKRPMTEQQDYMDIKKQRTAEANGEASTPILHIMEGEAA